MALELNERTKSLLRSINFSERHEKLVDEHAHKNYLDLPDPAHVKQLLINLGYANCSYHKKEQFFELEEINWGIDASFGVSVKYGVVEFLLSFSTPDKSIRCGGNYGFINKLLGSEKGYAKPVFSDYAELEQIMLVGIGIYNDIKTELLKQ